MMHHHFLHWGVNPIFLHLGPLKIHWYGLLFVAGLLLGLKFMRWVYEREGVNPDLVEPLLFYIVIGVIIGARLAHCFLYEPKYFLAHLLEVFAIWKGGLASHGGILGAIIALFLYTKRYKIPFLWLFARFIIPLFLVASFIRIGNLFNSEILGRVTNKPWGIVFERFDLAPRHPVMLYESFGYFMLFLFGLYLYKRLDSYKFTYLFPGIAIILASIVRITFENFKMPQADFQTGALLMGQWLTLPYLAVGIILLLWGYKRVKE